jgi:predicted phosphodiesterase
MRVAALYDIHGNLPALEAVLDEIKQLNVDLAVIGGDAVSGPMPRETLQRLMGLEIPVQFLYGNGETAILTEMAGEEPAGVPERFRHVVRWTAQQLQPEYGPVLAGWPATLRLALPELGEILFCHATPRNEHEIFTRLTPEESLLPVFEGVGAGLVVCGHTHMQFDRRVGPVRVVNAGSVGAPYGAPGACWLLLGPDVQLRRTAYDLVSAADRIRRTEYPMAGEFSNQVLRPPSEAEMLESFSRFPVR